MTIQEWYRQRVIDRATTILAAQALTSFDETGDLDAIVSLDAIKGAYRQAEEELVEFLKQLAAKADSTSQI